MLRRKDIARITALNVSDGKSLKVDAYTDNWGDGCLTNNHMFDRKETGRQEKTTKS